MRILFTGVYPHLYGGLERFAERSAAALRKEGHVVDASAIRRANSTTGISCLCRRFRRPLRISVA